MAITPVFERLLTNTTGRILWWRRSFLPRRMFFTLARFFSGRFPIADPLTVIVCVAVMSIGHGDRLASRMPD